MSLNLLLLCQENPPELEKSKDDCKLTSFYTPETPEDIGEFINEELLKQFSKSMEKTDDQMAKPAEWILESSVRNAPTLLKGIFFYLKSHTYRTDYTNASHDFMIVPSFHRFILVGPPGSGKTTMAHAIAYMLGYPVVFVAATSFLGRYRNETANNIQEFLRKCISDDLKKIIIIDELHKLFEHHNSDQSDDSQSAAAFWLTLDDIERYSPNTIIIATANNVDKLPPEIKSRFSGKVITIPMPNKYQKIRAFKNSIANDESLLLDRSIDNAFIAQIMQQIQNCSLRDVRLIIDTAKMFYYAEIALQGDIFPIVLSKKHFQQALDQLKDESRLLQGSLLEQLCKKIESRGSIFSAAANLILILRILYEISQAPQLKELFLTLYDLLQSFITTKNNIAPSSP